MTWFAVLRGLRRTTSCHRRPAIIAKDWLFVKGFFLFSEFNMTPVRIYVPFLQDPVLILHDQFLHLLAVIPQVPRPLKEYDVDRRKKLLQLADLVLKTQGNQCAARTVRYLVSLTNINAVPEAVAPLPWISTRCPGEFDELINLAVGSSVVSRVIPQMEFCARIGRRR